MQAETDCLGTDSRLYHAVLVATIMHDADKYGYVHLENASGQRIFIRRGESCYIMHQTCYYRHFKKNLINIVQRYVGYNSILSYKT